MPITVVKSIGTSKDYSTIAAWEAVSPASLYGRTRTSTCGSGSTTTSIVLDAGASATNSFYNNLPITIGGESRLITAYVGSTKTATVGALNGSSAAFSSAPSSGTAYVIDSAIWKGEIYKEGGGTDGEWALSSQITFGGVTTNATHYLWLAAASGASFKDHADKLTNALRYDRSKGVAISHNESYESTAQCTSQTRFTGLQLQKITAGNQVINADGASVVIENCILRTTQAAAAVVLTEPSEITNTLIHQTATSNAVLSLISASRYTNCTFIGPGSGTALLSQYASNSIVRNCAVFNFGTFSSGTFNTGSSGYNATNLGAALGSNNVTSLTYANQFENTGSGTEDFRVKSGNGLVAGTRDQTYTNDLDIVGQTRDTTTPTIGAWEVVAAGGDTFNESASDSAAATDSTTSALTAVGSITDSAAATDAATSALTAAEAVTDSAAGTDATTTALTVVEAVADSAAGTDAAASLTTLAESVSDSAAATDTAADTTSKNEAVADSAAATDTATAAAVLADAVSDAAAGSETLASVGTFVEAVTDSAAASETVTDEVGSVTYNESATDSAAASETLASIATLGLAITDAASGTDTVAGLAVMAEAVSDAAAASETVTDEIGAVTISESVEDAAAAQETLASTAALVNAQSDAAAVSDASSGILTTVNAVSDSAAATDAVSQFVALFDAITDAGALAETVYEIVTGPGNYLEAVEDTLVASDAVGAAAILEDVCADLAAGSDIIVRSGNFALLTALPKTKRLGPKRTVFTAGRIGGRKTRFVAGRIAPRRITGD